MVGRSRGFLQGRGPGPGAALQPPPTPRQNKGLCLVWALKLAPLSSVPP